MAKGHIIAGLDIGSGTIKILAVLKQKKEERLEVLAVAEEVSSGIRKGVVINPGQVSSLIQLALKNVEREIKHRIHSVYVSIGGCHLFCTSSHGLVSVSRADNKISPEDVERVLHAAQTFSLPSNREILEVFPREFIIDGEKGIKEVVGMQGVRLETEVLVLGGFAPYLKNLTSAVLNAGLHIDDLVFSSLASARAVLTPKEKELGVALLDIGAGTTDLAVFEEGDLIHTVVFPIGSAHITNDIATGLKTDIDVAEKIKLEFGTLAFQGGDKKEKIEVIEGENFVFSRKQLSRIIEARVAEIFREVSRELKKISKSQALPAGIVLTGGGAKLPRIKDLAKKEFRLHCRIGLPQGFSPEISDPRLAAVGGLILRGLDAEDKSGWGGSFSASGEGLGGKIKKIFKIFIP
jgi:cell division protein FtsA